MSFFRRSSPRWSLKLVALSSWPFLNAIRTVLREEVIVIIGGRLAELLLDLHQVAAANDAHRDFLRACAGGERGSEGPGVSERSWGARRATGWTRSTVPRNGRAAGRMDGVPAPRALGRVRMCFAPIEGPS